MQVPAFGNSISKINTQALNSQDVRALRQAKLPKNMTGEHMVRDGQDILRLSEDNPHLPYTSSQQYTRKADESMAGFIQKSVQAFKASTHQALKDFRLL